MDNWRVAILYASMTPSAGMEEQGCNKLVRNGRMGKVRNEMGKVQNGKSAEWEKCGMGKVRNGNGTEWERYGMGTVWKGKSTEWEKCGMGKVQNYGMGKYGMGNGNSKEWENME